MASITTSRRRLGGALALLVALTLAPACTPAPSGGGYRPNGTVVVPSSGPVLGSGSRGTDVTLVQDRLLQLGYYLADTRGYYGYSTRHAVTAFQKVQGIERDGAVGNRTRWFLNNPIRPAAASGSGLVIEVDRARQVVKFVENGGVRWVLDTSTGKASTPTPGGRYRIYRQINGYRHAPLGTLYRPKYFNGGVALHGSSSVPTYPASHGCVRLTNQAADFLWSVPWGAIGTRVWVY